MSASPALLAPGDPRVRLARRAIGGSLLTTAGFAAVSFVCKETLAVYNHAPWLNDPYDTAVSFALFCIPIIVVPCGLRMLAGRGSPVVPTSRLSDLLRAAALCLAVVAATAAAEWAAVAFDANRAAWSAATDVQIAFLAVVTAAAAACAASIRRASAAIGRVPDSSVPDWLGDLVEVALHTAGSAGAIGQPAVRLFGWAASDVLPAIRRHPLATAAGLGAAVAAAVTTSQSVNEGYRAGTSILFFCVAAAGVFAFVAVAGACLRVVRSASPSRQARPVVHATVLACAAVPVALAFRATLWPVAGASARHGGLAALWLLLAVAAVLTFGMTLLAERVAQPGRPRGGTG